MFNAIEKAKDLILEIDPDEDKSMNARRVLDMKNCCYNIILERQENVSIVQL